MVMNMQRRELRRILLATDGSAQAFRAVDYAAELAICCRAEITLLMVAQIQIHVSDWEKVMLGGQIPSELKVAAWAFLSDLIHFIPAFVPTHIRVEVGSPGETILSVAEEENSDLIVLGSRGMGSTDSDFIGSVSHYVLTHTECSVFLSKGMPQDGIWD